MATDCHFLAGSCLLLGTCCCLLGTFCPLVAWYFYTLARHSHLLARYHISAACSLQIEGRCESSRLQKKEFVDGKPPSGMPVQTPLLWLF